MSAGSILNRLNAAYWKTVNTHKIFAWGLTKTGQNKQMRDIIEKNRGLKNTHLNQRVFIVANGPSIKNENLDRLQGEAVFTVNQMIRKPEFVALNPICNLWFDPAYFDENMPDESKQEFQALFLKTSNCNDQIINVLPYRAYAFLERHSLISSRTYFLQDSLYFIDGYDKRIDLCKPIPGLQNIVQYAIIVAIYMGFRELYLLGVDSTGIITKINSVMGQSIEDSYSYQLGASGQKYVNSLLNYFSVEQQFAGWTRTFHLYKELARYCSAWNIKLVNCSSNTIIEGVPRERLERVLDNDK